MLSYSIDSKGVLKALDNIRVQCPNEMQGVVGKALDAGVKSARYNVPKDTRKLMRSIKIDDRARKFGAKIHGSYSARANNSKGKNYGVYQETGWHDKNGAFHEGRYYMKRSKDKAEKVLVNEANKVLGRYVRKV